TPSPPPGGPVWTWFLSPQPQPGRVPSSEWPGALAELPWLLASAGLPWLAALTFAWLWVSPDFPWPEGAAAERPTKALSMMPLVAVAMPNWSRRCRKDRLIATL